MRIWRWSAGVAIAALAVILVISLTGSVLIVDRDGVVEQVVLGTGDDQRSLWRLPGGAFIGLPAAEASIHITCEGGARLRRSYPGGRRQIWLRVEGDPPCRSASEL